jgi:hypothetical protein
VENAQSSTSSLRRFDGPGFFAEWEPDTDYLEASSNDRSDDGNETPVGEAEAFRRFRCALVQLERRSLVAPKTVPAEGAILSKLISASLLDGELSDVRVEAYWFRSNRLVDGVIEPYSPVIVRLDASGALQSVGLATPTIHSEGTPGKETPVAPGFNITRALSYGEIEARFRAEAEAEQPGQRVILGATGLQFRKRPMEFGVAILPMQWFHFFYADIASRGGNIWSYRIDDPSVPRWDEVRDP